MSGHVLVDAHAHEKRVPVLYLDLDGTVRWGKDELGHFVNGVADVVVFDEARERISDFKTRGWRIVGISNQGGVALGHVTAQDVARTMIETQRQARGLFDKIAWCSHHPNASDPEWAVCWCRKPRPGLVIESALAMAEKYPDEIYPPHMALFVGDRPEDRGCADAANIKFMSAVDWRAGKSLDGD